MLKQGGGRSNYLQQSVSVVLCELSIDRFLVCTSVAYPASVSQGICGCPFSAPSLVVGAYSWGSPVPFPVFLFLLITRLTLTVFAVCRIIHRHGCRCFSQPQAVARSWMVLGVRLLCARGSTSLLGWVLVPTSFLWPWAPLSTVTRLFSPPLGCKLCSVMNSGHRAGVYRHRDLVLVDVF